MEHKKDKDDKTEVILELKKSILNIYNFFQLFNDDVVNTSNPCNTQIR